MALARRIGGRGETSFIWPGFVDGLASLLMVIIFVLMVFFMIQINLARLVSGQNAAMDQLRSEISELASLLNMERNANSQLAATNQQLTLALDSSQNQITSLETELSDLQTALDAAQDRETNLRQQVEAARLLATQLREKLQASDNRSTTLASLLETARIDTETALGERDMLIDELESSRRQAEERLAGQLAAITILEKQIEALRKERDTALDDSRQATASLGASQEEVSRLSANIDALKGEILRLQSMLDVNEDALSEARESNLSLSNRLNSALTSRVAELQRFRSEFFGRLRDILQDRSEIRIVGDRFVFQSEVLFETGSSDIGADGERQLANLSIALKEIAENIPPDIDWVLQVDGHTDSQPVRSGRFSDNWDLSTERALSVVRFLVLSGIEPKRLAATGYGEFQPIDRGNSAAAMARNRRIELKLTQRLANQQQE